MNNSERIRQELLARRGIQKTAILGGMVNTEKMLEDPRTREGFKKFLQHEDVQEAVRDLLVSQSAVLIGQGKDHLKTLFSNTKHTKYAIPASAILMLGLSGMFDKGKDKDKKSTIGGKVKVGALGAGLGWLASTKGGKDTIKRAGNWVSSKFSPRTS